MAGSADSPDVQFRSAMLMLSGANPEQLEEGTALIEAAAAAAHPEATERLALLECKGVGRTADWNKALDTLATAAELGSQSAARQIILLAEDRFDSTEVEAPSGRCMELRRRIRIADRVRPPASDSRPLSLDPFLRPIPHMVSAAECQWLISRAAPHLERATVYNHPGEAHEGRTNQHAVLDLAHSDLVVETVRARIANELRAPLPCLEISQVLRYRVGEEFVLHCDFLDPRALRAEIDRNGQRSATFLIYLNDDFEGGETSFPALGIEHRGKPGDALVFGNVRPDRMPDPRTQHAGRAPTRGEKWVFSQWVRDRYAA